MSTPVHVAPRLPGWDTYRACVECRAYWTTRSYWVTNAIVERAAVLERPVADVAHRYRLDVHARHLAGLTLDTGKPTLLDLLAASVVVDVEPVVCCDMHIPGVGACCDPDDCGPCCRDCPTCPTLARRRPHVPRPTPSRAHQG